MLNSMHKLFKSHHPVRHVKSFKYAFQGLFHALLNEANFRIQTVFSLLTLGLGLYLKISHTDWGLLILANGFLLAAEMINTVVEEIIDNLIKEHHEGARIIKDLAAGFVLTAGLTALAIFLLIFGQKLSVII